MFRIYQLLTRKFVCAKNAVVAVLYVRILPVRACVNYSDRICMRETNVRTLPV
jgi:hypothetical protein